MEMVINAYALNVSSEQAIAPRQGVLARLMRKVVPSHILAITNVDAAE